MPPGTLVASVSLNQGSPAQARLAIIDTAPHSADAAIIAAEAADLVLVPCRPGRFGNCREFVGGGNRRSLRRTTWWS